MAVQRILTFRLDNRTAAAAFMAAVVVVAGGIAAAAMRVAYAEQLADSDRISRVTRATRFDPTNDSIQNRLGRMELWSAGDLEQATQHYRRALMLNPNKAEYWADLAHACQLAGQPSCAEAGLLHATQLAPMRPAYQWDLANHYVVTGDREKAFSSFVRLLSIAPEDAESALSICLRAYGDPDSIWRAVVVPARHVSVQLTMLTLVAHSSQGDTGKYWAETRDRKFDFEAVAPYVDTLIHTGNYDLALRVWADLQRIGVIPQSGGNSVYNGDFKNQPLTAGFDWHLVPQPFVESSIDTSLKQESRHSLRVEFTVPNNADLEPAYEIVPVRAGAEHVLRAWVKSEGITSESGPRLRVIDAECAACLDVSSTATTGTTDWHEIQMPFIATANTRAVRVSLYRSRAREFPMDISGVFWITSVTLDSNR